MSKTYYITESQYRTLVESKREQKKTLDAISEELDKKRSTLTEAAMLNEGIIDTIKKYLRAGALTAGIVASLLASQKVNAQQLQQAGVPTEMVQKAQQQAARFNPSQMTTKQIEDRMIQIMKKNNLQGSLNTYQKLSPQQKQNVLTGIQSKIKSLDDINHISFGNWEKYDRSANPNAIQFDQKSEQKISVETVDSVATIPMMRHFVFNSNTLQNPEQVRDSLSKQLANFSDITRIEIISSSSTLRNKHEAEGKTWKQLSQERAEAIANILIGQNIDLGGQGKNLIGKITPEMVKINSNGTNGDGTSGPKSPYEVNPEYIKSYQERGIDPKFWQSAAKEDALPETEIDQYNQYQYVNIVIYGRVVTTETTDVPSYRHVYLSIKKEGGKIETGQDKKVQDYSKCPGAVN